MSFCKGVRLRLAMAAMLVALVAPGAAAQIPEASSHTAAVRELIHLLELEKQTTVGLAAMRGGPLTADNPMAERLTEVITDFMREVLPWEKLEPEYIKLYQETFSEDEVRGLITFFKSPVGRKLVAETPSLTHQAGLVVQTMMQPHQAEFHRRMMEAMGLGDLPGWR